MKIYSEKDLIIVFVFSSLLGVGQIQENLKELLPKNQELSGWTIRDSIEIYSGDNLFNFINGGADIYLEYGFNEAVKCDLINPDSNQIRCEIYRMTNDSAAYGIFTFNASEKGMAVEAGNKALLYDHYIELWKDVFYIRCIAEGQGYNSTDTLLILAELISNKIAAQGKEPALTGTFNLENTKVKNVKYLRGIIGLNNVFNFGHGSIAGYSEGIACNLDDKMLFTFAYKDAYKCREWFASAKGKMQMNQKFTDLLPIETGFSIKSKTGEYFCFKPYKRFIIVIKGMTWEEAMPVIQQMERNLDGI
jgi:hypothetical protein